MSFPLLSPRERPVELSLYNEIEQVFQLFDINKDGYLTVEEIGNSLKKFLPDDTPDQNELKKMVYLFDKNFDGKVSFEEFAFFYAQSMGVPLRTINADEKLRKIKMDLDKRKEEEKKLFRLKRDQEIERLKLKKEQQKKLNEFSIDPTKSEIVGVFWNAMMIGVEGKFKFYPKNENGKIVKVDGLEFEIYCMADEENENIPKLASISSSKIDTDGGIEFKFTPSNEFNQNWYSFDISNKGEIVAQNTNVLIGNEKKIETEMKKYEKKIKQLEIKQSDSAATGLETKLGGQIEKLQKKFIAFKNLLQQVETESPKVNIVEKKTPPPPVKKPEINIDISKSVVWGCCWTVMMIGLKCSIVFYPLDSNGKIVKVDLSKIKFEIYAMADEDEEDVPKLACVPPCLVRPDFGIEFQFTPNDEYNQTWYSFDIAYGEEILAQNSNVLIGSKSKIENEIKKYAKKIKQLEIKQSDSAATGLETRLGGQIEKLQKKMIEYEKLMKLITQQK
eukprot:gene8875-824_t